MFYQAEHIGASDHFKRESGENFSYPLHLHRSFELILADEGEMTVTVDGESYLLRPGDGILIFPNQTHSLASRQSRHTLFIFSPRFIQAFFTEKAGLLPTKNLFSLPKTLYEALHALHEDASPYAIKGTLYSVCAHFDEVAVFRAASEDRADLLPRLFSYVEANFQGSCELTALAAAVGYNPEYISRVFKRKTGIPYNTYLNARRLSHAAYLLTNTDKGCLSVAMESGYTSLRSFNRNFKLHFKVTPAEYRRTRPKKADRSVFAK